MIAKFNPLTLWDLIQAAPGGDPAIILPETDVTISYKDLRDQVAGMADALASLEIQPGDRVATYLPNGLPAIVSLLAACIAGTAAPLNPGYREDEVAFYLDDTGAKILLCPPEGAEAARKAAEGRGVRVYSVETDATGRVGIAGVRADRKAAPPSHDAVALVLHTSGSTGRPKRIPITHRNISASAQNIAAHYALSAQDVSLCVMPLFHVHGLVASVLSTFLSGGTVVLPREFDPLAFWRTADARKVTWYTAVPTIHNHLLARASEERLAGAAGLRFIRSCSSPLPPEMMARMERAFGVPVLEAYGMTEACHQMASNPHPPAARKPGSVGLGTGVEIGIMDDAGNLLATGVPGEVVIQGPNVVSGYENNAEANASAFHKGWFRTGDQGFLDADGYLTLTGRLKEQINRGGEKIAPREIDEVLLRHPAVAEAICFGIPDEKLGEEVGVAVVLRKGQAASEAELRQFAATSLARFKVPRRVVFVQEIPKGATGKAQRLGLAAKLGLTDANPAPAGLPFTPPRTPTEERLAELWRQVLGVDSVSVHDDFFGAGGDSILVSQFCSRVEAALGRKLPFTRMFEDATLEGLAAWLDSTAGQDSDGPAAPSIQPSAGRTEVPLSYAQQQFWFLDKFEMGGANFIRMGAYRLSGPLDTEALRWSLNQIVARHQILRTTYHERDGHERDGLPVQTVREARELALPLSDLSAVPEPQRMLAAHELARKEAWRPFDLSADLMLRAGLARLAPEEHILLLTMHHIASDGWSSRLLLRELAELYAARTAGRAPLLPDLPIQYADFARFEQQCFERGLLDGQIKYWKERLAGAPELLTLPTDRPRPDRQTYRGGIESLVLPTKLLAALKHLALQDQATLYMVLLAAFQVLLHRYTGDQDLVVGSPVAGRTTARTEPLIGLFSNVLAMRADLQGDPTFHEFLARTRAAALGAQANQDVPTERLIEQLALNRSARHPALFQVLLQLRNLGAESVHLGSVTLDPFDFDAGTGQFDLSLDIRERAAGLYCRLNYNSDLYDGATAQRILSHFQTLLESITRNAGARVSQLNILPEEERRQVLIGWNRTAVDYPRNTPIHKLIEARAQANPEAIAVVFKNEQITYQELNRRANGWAHHLRGRGVGRDVLVGISLERWPALAVAVLAVLKAGGAYVPLDPEYPRPRLTAMLEDARCPLLITTSARAQNIPSAGIEVLCVDREIAPADRPPVTESQAGDCAYVIFTSGSTGKPNGVLVEHRSLVNNSHFFARYVGLQAGDRVLQLNSISFDTAAEEIFPCWLSGATLVFWPEPKPPSIAEFLDFAERERITLADLPTAYWHEWAGELAVGQLPFPSRLRTVVIGGEKAIASKLAAWNRAVGGRIRLCNTYGPTEATITSTAYDPDPKRASADSVPIGRPIDNTTLYILDPSLQPVPIGVPGELYIGGAGVARGYLNRPELTAQRFVKNPFLTAAVSDAAVGDAAGDDTPAGDIPVADKPDDPRLYKTGDRARYLADGTVEFLGRNDDQVKWRGFRIELGEVENALAAHPQVRMAAASLLDELVAYIVPDLKSPPSIDQLRGFLKERVPDYMLPSHYIFLEKLPTTPSGKVDRRALPQPTRAHLPDEQGFVAPRTDLERQIAAIWKDILGIDRIGVHDNFFDVGGHSLKVVQVLSRMRTALQVDLPLRRVFEGPTVAEVAIGVLETFAEGLDAAELAGILAEVHESI